MTFTTQFRIADLINWDPEAFQRRVREFAYAQAMNKLNLPEDLD